MTRTFVLFSTLWLLAAPVSAQDMQTIGLIEAVFADETLSQTTVSYLDDGQRRATASLANVANLTALTIQSADRTPVIIEAMFNSTEPGPQTAPIDVMIGYFPSGMQSYWTSEDAGEPAQLSFEVLDDTQAIGTFEALLCFVPEGAEEPDTANCEPISGRFETALIRE